jgi:hypothetical protein
MVFRNYVIRYTIDFILSDNNNICNIFEPFFNFLLLTNEKLELKKQSLVQKYKSGLSENMTYHETLQLKTIYPSIFQKYIVMPPLELLNSINVEKCADNFCKHVF